jgi:ABC-type nitrate/sulfonate/bicarbonate transport system substrate-binding protein
MAERLRVIEFVPAAVQALAADLGYLDDSVEFMRTRSSTEQRERVMSDECDAAPTAIDNLIAWDADGDDLRLVAQIERATVLDLIAAPEVQSIAELRGRALAVDAPDNGFAIVLRKVLADHGLSDSDYRLSSEGGIAQRFAALVEGRAAAGLLGPPWSYQALEAGLIKLAGVHEVLPSLPGIGVAVRQSRLEELHAPVTRYLVALGRAISWLASASREEALGRLASAGFEGRGAEDLLAVAPTTLAPSRAGLELLFDMRRELGLLPDGGPSPATLLADLAIPPVAVT